MPEVKPPQEIVLNHYPEPAQELTAEDRASIEATGYTLKTLRMFAEAVRKAGLGGSGADGGTNTLWDAPSTRAGGNIDGVNPKVLPRALNLE